jgi:hypothetical protein
MPVLLVGGRHSSDSFFVGMSCLCYANLKKRAIAWQWYMYLFVGLFGDKCNVRNWFLVNCLGHLREVFSGRSLVLMTRVSFFVLVVPSYCSLEVWGPIPSCWTESVTKYVLIFVCCCAFKVVHFWMCSVPSIVAIAIRATVTDYMWDGQWLFMKSGTFWKHHLCGCNFFLRKKKR